MKRFHPHSLYLHKHFPTLPQTSIVQPPHPSLPSLPPCQVPLLSSSVGGGAPPRALTPLGGKNPASFNLLAISGDLLFATKVRMSEEWSGEGLRKGRKGVWREAAHIDQGEEGLGSGEGGEGDLPFAFKAMRGEVSCMGGHSCSSSGGASRAALPRSPPSLCLV